MAQVEVVRDSQLTKGQSTDGIARLRAFESSNLLVSQSRVAGGVISGWHHHGKRHLYGYLVQGNLRLEYQSGKKQTVSLNPGDFFHIPVGLVHRDLNTDKSHELIVVNILVGEGPPVVNVEGPSEVGTA
jgi:quercetin dioxygenase-like cupin family protein